MQSDTQQRKWNRLSCRLTLLPPPGPKTCSAKALMRLLALPVVTAGPWDETLHGGDVSIGTTFSSFSCTQTSGQEVDLVSGHLAIKPSRHHRNHHQEIYILILIERTSLWKEFFHFKFPIKFKEVRFSDNINQELQSYYVVASRLLGCDFVGGEIVRWRDDRKTLILTKENIIMQY